MIAENVKFLVDLSMGGYFCVLFLVSYLFVHLIFIFSISLFKLDCEFKLNEARFRSYL